MRVLLFIIQYPPDVNSTGLLMAQICEDLVRMGHEVTVVTSFPHYDRFRVREDYRGRWIVRETRNGVRVVRMNVYARGSKQVMLHRLLNYLGFNLGAAVAGVASRRPFDVVLCTNGSFFTGVTGWMIGRWKQAPFVLNVQDLYPDVPIQAGQLRNPATIASLRRIERFMYRNADHVTVITPSFQSHLMAKGVPAEKVSVIPNFVDTDFIRPLPRDNPFSRRHGLTDRFVVSHAGNVGVAYDLDTLLEAAALLRDRPEIVFLVVGEGVAKARLTEKAARLGLANVRFLPFQPFEELPWLRAASDVQVALYRRGAGRYSMPCKVYEIMASGRPLLAGADPGTDLRELLERVPCGTCVEPEDPEALARAVGALYEDPDAREAMSRRGRAEAEARYSRKAVVASYERLLARVVDGAPAPATASR